MLRESIRIGEDAFYSDMNNQWYANTHTEPKNSELERLVIKYG